MMLNCKEASQLISQSLERPLSFSERWRLKVHLWMCDACRRFKQQLNQLRSHIKTLMQQTEDDESIQLSQAAKKAISNKIDHHTAS
jgi:predicted anti-sigma-YlaC factor YlaD